MAFLTRRRLAIAGLGVGAGTAALPFMLAIAPLLPAGEGKSTCFEAIFEGGQQLVSGWHREKPVPAPVTRMIVRIHHPEGEEPYRDTMTGRSYDWRYTAYVGVTVKGRGQSLVAPTICEWRRHPVNAVDPWLGCYLECDGGGIWLRRVAGRRAIDVVWRSDEHLRMSSCGGGEILRAGATTQVFRLEVAPEQACAGVVE